MLTLDTDQESTFEYLVVLQHIASLAVASYKFVYLA